MRIAGIDIGGGSIKAGLFDPAHGLLQTETFPTPLGDSTGLVRCVAQFARKVRAEQVGIGTAGSIDARTGLLFAGNLDLWGIPLRSMLEEELQIPVWVDNDAQAALMAEVYDGACKGLQNVIYLTLGTGVGGAALIEGRPWRGHTHTALELGHMITHADGLPCACTRQGCFEMYASARALSRMAGGIPAKQAIQGAKAAEPDMTRAFREYLHELGIGLMNIISIFNPEMIVLGGGISKAGAFFLSGVREEVARLSSRRPNYFQGRIELAFHQNDAGMIGAATLAHLLLSDDGTQWLRYNAIPSHNQKEESL